LAIDLGEHDLDGDEMVVFGVEDMEELRRGHHFIDRFVFEVFEVLKLAHQPWLV